MYSVVLWLAATTGGDVAACPRVIYYCPPAIQPMATIITSATGQAGGLPNLWQAGWMAESMVKAQPVIVTPATAAEEEESESEAKVHPQTESDMRMLGKLMELIPNAEERKQVQDYWLSAGVDSKARKEFYDDLMKEAGEETDEPWKDVTEAAPCTIVVNLPAAARLYIDGEQTRSTSGRRTFVSPPLTPGRTFNYHIAAEFDQDGATITVKRVVKVWAGSTAELHIDPESE